MRVLVYEPDFAGHHFAHLSLLVPALRQYADRVIVATSAAAVGSAPYRTYLEPHAATVEIDAWMPDRRPGAVAAARDSAAAFRASVQRARPDRVYVPYADGLSQILGVARLLGSRAWARGAVTEALLMRGAFAYAGLPLKRRVFARASWAAAKRAPWDHVFHLDPLIVEAARRQGGSFSRRLRLMPEPMEPPPATGRDEARRALGLPEGGRYIGSAGLIDERKGCDLLIRAFAEARLGAQDRLLLAGGHHDRIKGMLAGAYAPLVRSGSIVSLDRFLTHEELGLALRAMDLVCTPYPAHIGSASIVIRAAAAERPVVGTTFGWVGWAIERFGLGYSCDVASTSVLAEALRRGLDLAGRFGLNEAARRFVAFHTPENYVRTWIRGIRESAGQPPERSAHSWEWVTDALEPRTESRRGP